MKKNFLTFAIATMVLAFGLASCSNDDSDNQTKNLAAEVEGTYQGGAYATFSYVPEPFQPEASQSVTITANKDGKTVNVNFNNSTWGTFIYNAVKVKKNSDGSYTLEGEGNCVILPMPTQPGMPNVGNSEPKSYISELKGTITNGTLVAEFFVPAMMGGTTIWFNPADFDKVANTHATAVEGTYKGDIYATFPYVPNPFQPEENQVVTITANDDKATYTVRFINDTWGTFTYSEVTVEKNEDGSYSLEGAGTCEVINEHNNGEKKTYQSDLTGTITKNTLVAQFFIPELMNGTTIWFNPEDFNEVFNTTNGTGK